MRELVVFAALVVLGLLAWFAGSPGIMARLFGVDLSPLSPGNPYLPLLFTLMVCGVLALVAGFAFPKGFYLWGVALNLHGPFVQVLTIYLMQKEGTEWLVGGTQSAIGYVVLSALLFLFTVLFYTALSALGAGARYLSRRMTRQ
jgi:hypothetical protein